MRIEDRIKVAYREEAGVISVPALADKRARARIERLLKTKQGRSAALSRRAVKWALAGSLALLVMGFTAQYFVRIGDDRFSMEMAIVDEVKFDAHTANLVRQQLQTVRNQLAVGEKALVYSSEIESLLPDYRSKDLYYAEYVSNPYLFTDYGQWKERLADLVPQLVLPDERSSGLVFVSGKDELAFGGFVTEMDVAKRLQTEVADKGTALAWEKITRSESLFDSYTSSYKDASGDELSFTVQVNKEGSKFVSLTQARSEKLKLSDGREALYAFNDKFLYSDTNRYVSLSWVDTQAESPVLYTLGSFSLSMTKERLIAVAESMVAQQIKAKPAA